jgi:hypothetical protein
MIVDENGNSLSPRLEDPAAPAAPVEAPAANPLEPVMVAMGLFTEAIQKEDSPETREEVRKNLANALDAFCAGTGQRAVRGKDYEIVIRSVPNGPVQVALQDLTTRGRDFRNNWAQFIQDMEASAARAQEDMFRAMTVGKIQALEGIVNQLLLKVAALEGKVR